MLSASSARYPGNMAAQLEEPDAEVRGVRQVHPGEKCPRCGGKTVTVHPARYSPDDRYARYRSPLAYEKPGQGTT